MWVDNKGQLGRHPLHTNLDLPRIGAAGGCFVGGIILGYLVYRVVSARIRRSESLTRSGGVGFTIAAVRDVAIVWFTIGGAYAGISFLRLTQEAHRTGGRGLLV